MVAFEKHGQHPPPNRQAERFAREGVALGLSTRADLAAHATVALEPLHALIAQHVRATERLHGENTTVPLPARGGTITGRLWTCARDDRPFAGGAPPAALFFFSTDREKTHPDRYPGGWQGMPHRPTPMAAATTSADPAALRGR